MDRSFFQQLSTAARAAIREQIATGLIGENKAALGYDPVTAADREAERALRRLIEQRFPDHEIWGEEFGLDRGESSTRWSLDPVDGTRALLCDLPSWAILIALIKDGEHVAGMIDLPAVDQTFVALDGVTLLNGKPVQASQCTSLSQARFSTTDPFLFPGDEAAAVERVRQAVRLARYGLDAMAYARIASGGLDLVIESGLKPHDYDALIPVVRGAGGHIGDWEGGTAFESGRIVAAATRPLYEEAVALLA